MPTLDPSTFTVLQLNKSKSSAINTYATVQQALNFALSLGLTEIVINVGVGTYSGAISVPQNIGVVINGSINGQTFIGDVSWATSGNQISNLVIRDCTVNSVAITDGAGGPATFSILALENCNVTTNITQIGTSMALVFLTGLVNGATQVPGILPSSNMQGLISLPHCNITAENTAITGTITTQVLSAHGCSFAGNISCSGASIDLTHCNFAASLSFAFTGTPGLFFLDGISTVRAKSQAVSLVNGALMTLSPVAQTRIVEVTANITTASTVFVDLDSVTTTITTSAGSKLMLHFVANASNTNSNSTQTFRFVIDGVAGRGGASTYTGVPVSMSIAQPVTGLTAGTHTIKVQWMTSAHTAQIRPVAAPNTESACLTVQEVLV